MRYHIKVVGIPSHARESERVEVYYWFPWNHTFEASNPGDQYALNAEDPTLTMIDCLVAAKRHHIAVRSMHIILVEG